MEGFIPLLILLPALVLILLIAFLNHFLNGLKRDLINNIEASAFVLNTIRKEIHALKNESQEYSYNEPPPYTEPAKHFWLEYQQIREQYHRHTRQHRLLLKEVPFYGDSLVRRMFYSLAFINDWRRLSFRVKEMTEAVKELNGCEIRCLHFLEELKSLPAEVVQRVNKKAEIYNTANKHLEEFHRQGFHGEQFESAIEIRDSISQTLGSIPSYFFESSIDLSISESSKADVVSTWQKIEQIEKTLQEFSATLIHWYSVYRSADANYQELQSLKSSIGLLIDEMPSFVEGGGLFEPYGNLLREAQEVHEKYRRPAVENLEELEKHIRRLVGKLHQLESQIKQVFRAADELKQVVSQINQLTTSIAETMDQALDDGQFVFKWEQTAKEVKNLQSEIANVASFDNRLSPEQLCVKLDQAKDLRNRLQIVFERVKQIQSKTNNYISNMWLIQNIDTNWGERAQSLKGSIVEYSIENWSRVDKAYSISEDAQGLLRKRESLIEGFRQLVYESEIDYLYDQAQLFILEKDSFLSRLDRTESKLRQIRSQEGVAQEILQDTHAALERLNLDNSVFESELLRTYQSEVKRLQIKGSRLKLTVTERKDGKVLNKVKEVKGWQELCSKLFHSLNEELQSGIQQAKEQLRNKLSELHEIAPLNDESAIKNGTDTLHYILSEYRPQNSGQELRKMAVHINKLLELLERLKDAVEILETEIEQKIKRKYQRLKGLHDEARKELESLGTSVQKAHRYNLPISYDQGMLTKLSTRLEQEKRELKQCRTVLEVSEQFDRMCNLNQEIWRTAREQRWQVDDQIGRLSERRKRIEQVSKGLQWLSNHEDTVIAQTAKQRLEKIKDLLREVSSLSYDEMLFRLTRAESIAYQDFPVERGVKIQYISFRDIIDSSIDLQQQMK